VASGVLDEDQSLLASADDRIDVAVRIDVDEGDRVTLIGNLSGSRSERSGDDTLERVGVAGAHHELRICLCTDVLDVSNSVELGPDRDVEVAVAVEVGEGRDR